MPKSLIILENHSCSSAKDFIINNIVNLKELGYKTFLLEVPKEHSPASYKSQLKNCVLIGQKNPDSPEAKMMIHAKPMLAMLEALDKYQIPYKFIDPQSESSNQMMVTKAMQKFQSGEFKSIEDMKKQLTADNIANAKKRDKEMAATTLQTMKNNGSIVFLGGFMHTELVTLLQTNSSDCRYAIFTNGLENYPKWDSQNALHQTWAKLSENTFRNQFYGANVNYFNLATKPSFEMIEAVARLTNSESCLEPTVGLYLRESTKQDYNYFVDSHYVVSASAEIDNENAHKVVNKIEMSFPGLHFFTKQKLTTTSLLIPGINLPENHDVLSEGFIKAGVMNR